MVVEYALFMFKHSIVLALLAAACVSSSMVPRANTQEEVVAYVNRAADLVAARGAAACDALRQPRWFSGDWYVFVFDEEGRTVCHPAQPAMVGTMAGALIDPNGKKFSDEMMRTSEDGDWVDYAWPQPGGTTPVAKSAYVRSVRAHDGQRYVVGSGGYGLR